MFKEKPFLLASIIFGALGLIMLILTVISFFCGDQLISGAIRSMLNLDSESFNDSTMAQIAVVLFLPTFIFAYRSFADSDDDVPAAPAAVYAGNAGNVRSPLTPAAVMAEISDEAASVTNMTETADTFGTAESDSAETADSEEPQIELTDADVTSEPEDVITETAETEPEAADIAVPTEDEAVSGTTEE